MNSAVVNSLVKFLVRRGLSLLGAAGATVSDDWVTQTASLIVLGANEAFQWWKAHQAEKAKGA